jgi:type IV pilus assembly protein PilE
VYSRYKRTEAGFTLIELMITVVVIGIITAIAYPSYTGNVTRARRADVRGAISENAQFMERFFTENNRYNLSAAATPVAPVLPILISPRTATGTQVMYNLSLINLTPTTFTIQAVPANSMTGDACVTYTLNNLGQKGNVAAPTSGMTVDTCWSK